MDYWMAEEVARLTCAERQRERDLDRLQHSFSTSQADPGFMSRAALKLGHWLIAAGETLRRHEKKTVPVLPWVDVRKWTRSIERQF